MIINIIRNRDKHKIRHDSCLAIQLKLENNLKFEQRSCSMLMSNMKYYRIDLIDINNGNEQRSSLENNILISNNPMIHRYYLVIKNYV